MRPWCCPRFAALLLTIPLLTFVATIAGLAGGMLVVWSVAGPVADSSSCSGSSTMSAPPTSGSASPKLRSWPPVIAAIGCRQGMEVGNDVESLGRRVTAAVVHAIFAIILIDAVFALIYMELDI